ncbi:restriction endonuclease subunit S [Campylobacter vicugnae]|uniref:restriction endonuclease subunit S n=1 Tax=Campylobacter vicugnae TaxID=1660076 RepID=UPI000A340EE1|nr:restriction endonuclease subunit S [Campylobacter sp. RM8964]
MANTPKIRFKNFSDEWENNNLGEICKIIKGEQINKLSLLENGKYYVLNGGISPSGYINTYNTLENTISISEGGNSCGYVKFNIEKFWSGGHNYTLNELKTKTLFLYSFLKAKQQKIMALRVGSGLPNIQKNTLSNISISIPNSEEQEKIGAFFSKLDKLISLHQSKFEKLQKIKKSCLQNLFPQNNQNTPKIRFKILVMSGILKFWKNFVIFMMELIKLQIIQIKE